MAVALKGSIIRTIKSMVVATVVLGVLSTARAESNFLTLGTGGFTGVYYPAGGSICRLVNNQRQHHGIRCSVQSTGGSVDNLQQVRSGELDMGIAQADWLAHAYRGSDRFKASGADQQLRTLFSLYPEYFTVVTRADSGITKLDQLKGKRVSVGKVGSGQRATLEVLMRLKGWTMDDFSQAMEVNPADQASALCAGKIDVMIYTLGHPNGATKEVTHGCNSRIVEIDDAAVAKMVRDYPYYRWAIIPAGMYPGNERPIRTLGVMATFFSNDQLNEERAYQMVKAVFEQAESFRRLHPAFDALVLQQMVKGPFSAPLHPGAKRYFVEQGLIAP
ncbi:MAG: TAXI family TRAP transporter solute-binding subunit [Motiliproteus sp.]|nr:TAXI family TRAP transporter solute-binding subunit [Motiliproteus sp.]MCW9053879.1 TAXI family TRAP transporter solute-binding subunit [Motiliproteus sp.]